MRRTWIIEVADDPENPPPVVPGVELMTDEGAAAQVVNDAAAIATMLTRIGGTLVISAISEKAGEAPAANGASSPGTPLYRRRRYVCRYFSDSQERLSVDVQANGSEPEPAGVESSG